MWQIKKVGRQYGELTCQYKCPPYLQLPSCSTHACSRILASHVKDYTNEQITERHGEGDDSLAFLIKRLGRIVARVSDFWETRPQISFPNARLTGPLSCWNEIKKFLLWCFSPYTGVISFTICDSTMVFRAFELQRHTFNNIVLQASF